MKPILITSPAAISTKLTMLIHQNELYTQISQADGLNINIQLISLGPICEDDNGTK